MLEESQKSDRQKGWRKQKGYIIIAWYYEATLYP